MKILRRARETCHKTLLQYRSTVNLFVVDDSWDDLAIKPVPTKDNRTQQREHAKHEDTCLGNPRCTTYRRSSQQQSARPTAG